MALAAFDPPCVGHLQGSARGQCQRSPSKSSIGEAELRRVMYMRAGHGSARMTQPPARSLPAPCMLGLRQLPLPHRCQPHQQCQTRS